MIKNLMKLEGLKQLFQLNNRKTLHLVLIL